VILPAGKNFKHTATITIPDGGALIGEAPHGSSAAILTASGVSGPAIELNPTKTPAGGQYRQGQRVSGIRLAGTATNAIDWRGVVHASVEHVREIGTYSADANLGGYTFNCRFHGINTDGANFVGAAFKLTSYFNQNDCSVWYTGGGSTVLDVNVGVQLDGANGIGANVFRAMALQGVGTGFWVRQVQSSNVLQGLYTENTRLPIRLGDRANTLLARNTIILGGHLAGPGVSHPGYASRGPTILVDYSVGEEIHSPEWVSVDNGSPPVLWAVYYNKCFGGSWHFGYVWGGGLGSDAYTYIRKTADYDNTAGFTLHAANVGSGGSSGRLVKSQQATKFVLMEMNDATAANTLVTPGFGTMPPVATDPIIWAATTVFSAGATAYNALTKGNAVYSTVGGTSGSTPLPNTNTIGATASDGVLTWTCVAVLA
jgi:hypothetical protein